MCKFCLLGRVCFEDAFWWEGSSPEDLKWSGTEVPAVGSPAGHRILQTDMRQARLSSQLPVGESSGPSHKLQSPISRIGQAEWVLTVNVEDIRASQVVRCQMDVRCLSCASAAAVGALWCPVKMLPVSWLGAYPKRDSGGDPTRQAMALMTQRQEGPWR
jgi:hypothetical protein